MFAVGSSRRKALSSAEEAPILDYRGSLARPSPTPPCTPNHPPRKRSRALACGQRGAGFLPRFVSMLAR